jgi:hypothetical protein
MYGMRRPRLWCALLMLSFWGQLASSPNAPASESRIAASAVASVSHTGATSHRLRVGGRAQWRTLLRFEVPPSARTILRLRISGRAGRGLLVRGVTSARRWRPREARRLPLAGVIGKWKPACRRDCKRSRWIAIDVSAAVPASGRISLAVMGRRGASVIVARRHPPALVLESAASPPPAGDPPPTVPQPPPGESGQIPLSDAEAAERVRRSPFEPRPGNATANNRTPTAAELQTYRRETQDWRRCHDYPDHVSGAFTGTTDEILQWAAAKWGLDADLLRAVAVIESWWDQSVVNGDSFGLFQVQLGSFPAAGDLPRVSTAFSADLYGATIRTYYAGCATWLNTVPEGRFYAAGDLWGSVGAWYAGRWHTDAAEVYIARVVDAQRKRTWESADF